MKKITLLALILLCISGCEKKEINENINEIVDVKNVIDEKSVDEAINHINEDKSERVYAKADAYGNIETIEVDVTLKSDDKDKIEDISILSDIQNTGEDEKFIQEENKLIFENKGSDIHYKGISNKPLPISLSITYFLNGEEIKAEDLKGKTGSLEMRFDYVNNTSRIENGKRIIDPFMAISVLVIDEDVFSNIEIENGKLLQFGDVKAVMIYSFPQIQDILKLNNYKLTKDIKLNDYGIIKADVRDFSLAYTTTILSNGVFKEIDDEDLKQIDSLVADSDDFEKNAHELTDNTAKLYDATVALANGIKKYTEGTSTIDTYLSQMIEGSKQLNESIDKIKELPQIKIILDSIATEKNELLNSIKVSIDETSLADDEKEEKKLLFEKYLNDIDEDIASATIDENELNYIKETEKMLLQKYMSDVYLRTYLQELSKGSSDLTSGLSKIKQGSETLIANNDSINDGLQELNNAARQFDEGMNDFVNDDLNEIMQLSGNSLKEIVSQVRSLRTIDQEYGCYSGLMEGKIGKSTFIIETAAIE